MRVACCLLVFVLAAQAGAASLPGARQPLTFACMLALNLVGAFCAVRASRGRNRTAWLLVAAGQGLTIATNTAMGAGQFWLGSACGMAMYTAFALAALTFPAQNLRGWALAGLVGEALAVLGCGFMFVWYFVLRPHMAAHDLTRWPLSIGFPLGDLLLLIGISAVVLRGGLNASSRPLMLLIGGLSIFLLADAGFNAIGDDGNHTTGPLAATMIGTLAGLCITLASHWQAIVTGAARSQPAALRRQWGAEWFSYLPNVAVGLGLALMVVVTVQDGQLMTWGGLVLGLTVVTAGVALRQIVSLRESREHETSDPLTGLTNRVGLDRHLSRAVRRGQPIALLLVDLDGFKAVNDTYGHRAGDLLLVEFGSVLRRSVRGTDVACRVGGDEFVLLQRDVTAADDALALANRILTGAATSPIQFGEHSIVARASVGAALAGPGETADDVRHHADIAMYQAKRAGMHGVVLYETGMMDRRADDAALGHDLEAAVESGQLRVLYQPMIDLGSGRPLGAEALVRWHHPLRGVVEPLDFIPVAERTGAITGVGLFVLEQACRDVQAWPEHLYVSVNLSPRQLQDRTLVPDVLGVLDRTGLPPSRLVLEITESAIVDDRIAVPALETLRAHGIRIAIDDFGTGYSSLQYLSRLPVDVLKIDRSFVAELDGTRQGSAITEAVIRLAEILDLTLVAEGIERPEQETELRALGCQAGQGFLYARPQPAADVTRFVATAVRR